MHVIANQRARWCGPFQGFPPVTIRSLRPPLAPPLGELAAKPTERVKFALSAPFRGHLSHRERQVTLIRHGYAVPPLHYGAIATGNHFNFDSLRGAPPLVSKGSLCASPVVLGISGGLPHQSADWLAMTYVILFRSKTRTIPSGTQRYHDDRPAMHALAVGPGGRYGILTKPFNIV